MLVPPLLVTLNVSLLVVPAFPSAMLVPLIDSAGGSSLSSMVTIALPVSIATLPVGFGLRSSTSTVSSSS